jgi:ABC-type phosphate transport system substrate-binding protein
MLFINLNLKRKIMKKLLLGAAVSAALFGGAAQAAITLDPATNLPVITPANTYEIFLSGSSAAGTFFNLLFTSSKLPAANRICDSSKLIYKFHDTATVGKDQVAYLCELNTANPALTGLAAGKTNLLIYKRDAGGSGMGVTPVVADSAIDFLRVDTPANCTKISDGVAGISFTKINCTYTAGNVALSNSQKPDFGISDVDPIQFQGDNTPSGLAPVTADDVSKLTITPAAAQVFGVVVSTKLRNAMQEATFGVGSKCVGKEDLSCMPSLNSAQIASIFTGQISSWDQLKVSGTDSLFSIASAANKPVSSRMHICRRGSGSGTQAQLAIKFMGYPCNSVATQGAVDNTGIPESLPKAQIHAMSSAGAMEECLSELDSGSNTVGTSFNNTFTDGARWAIGIQGSEKNALRTSAYRFIKIDGVEPTLDKVVRGKYKDWVELTYQYNNTHAWDQSEKEVVDEIIKEAGNPIVMAATNLGAVHSWGKSGFLAAPKFYTGPATGLVSYDKPVNILSHGTTAASTNNCRMPATYSTGTGVQFK